MYWKIDFPPWPVFSALCILSGEIIAAVLYPKIAYEFVGIFLVGIILAIILFAIGYRGSCSLYYTWDAFPITSRMHALRTSPCGKKSIGFVFTTKFIENIFVEKKEFFCAEHNPNLEWMRDWLVKERISVIGSVRYFKNQKPL